MTLLLVPWLLYLWRCVYVVPVHACLFGVLYWCLCLWQNSDSDCVSVSLCLCNYACLWMSLYTCNTAFLSNSHFLSMADADGGWRVKFGLFPWTDGHGITRTCCISDDVLVLLDLQRWECLIYGFLYMCVGPLVGNLHVVTRVMLQGVTPSMQRCWVPLVDVDEKCLEPCYFRVRLGPPL